MASPPPNHSLNSNCKKCTTVADPPSSLKKKCSFHYHPRVLETSMQTRVRESQAMHPTTGPTNCAKLTVDGCRRHQCWARSGIKIQSRTSDKDQDQTKQVQPCSVPVRLTRCQDHLVHAETSLKIGNDEVRSSEKRPDASVATAPCAREELRRFLASSNPVLNIEERIRSLERENVQMLLEAWRSKLELVRAKRQLRDVLFRLNLEKIMGRFKF